MANVVQNHGVAAIVAERLDKTFAKRRKRPICALSGVSLTVERGEIFGLLGPNGAGKTTLIKILLGIVHPDRGSARLFGNDVSVPSSRRSVGFLPENHRFPPELTATQALLIYGHLSGMDRKSILVRMDPLLDEVGLLDRRNSRIRTFSKGMMQRLGIAQALLSDPDILFLDEPTDGVDPGGRLRIRSLLTRLSDAGKTVFLNSHLLSEIEQICSRVAILQGGNLVKTAAVDELTGDVDRWSIGLRTAGDEDVAGLLAAFECSVIASLPDGVHIDLVTPDELVLNEVLDLLRSRELIITRVERKRTSLESRFMDFTEETAP